MMQTISIFYFFILALWSINVNASSSQTTESNRGLIQMNQDIQITINNAYMTEALSLNAPSCLFFEAIITGTKNDSDVTFNKVSADNFEFKPIQDHSLYKIIQRNTTSDLSDCNDSGNIIPNLITKTGIISLSPLNQFIRINKLTKLFKQGDTISLTFDFTTAQGDKNYQVQANIIPYKTLLMNAKKLYKATGKL